MIQKGSKWVAKKKVPQNSIEWPCPPPFAEIHQEKEKSVAHIHIDDKNMNQIKEVSILFKHYQQIVKGIESIPGYFARRLSTIPSNRLNFEKCRMIVRNIPFSVSVSIDWYDQQISEKKIYNLFAPHAPIHHITLPMQENSNMNKGYCFIQYYCNADVDTVVTAMNGYSWNVGE